MPLPLFVLGGVPLLAQVKASIDAEEEKKIRSKLKEETDDFIGFLAEEKTMYFFKLAQKLVNRSKSEELLGYNSESTQDLQNILEEVIKKKDRKISSLEKELRNTGSSKNLEIRALKKALRDAKELKARFEVSKQVLGADDFVFRLGIEKKGTNTMPNQSTDSPQNKIFAHKIALLEKLKKDFKLQVTPFTAKTKYQGVEEHGKPSAFIREQYGDLFKEGNFHVGMLRKADPYLYQRLRTEIIQHNEHPKNQDNKIDMTEFVKTKDQMLRERTLNLLELFDCENPDELAGFLYSIKGRDQQGNMRS